MRNEGVAREMYAELDDKGYIPATLNLADIYAKGVNGGITVKKDIPEAIELY